MPQVEYIDGDGRRIVCHYDDRGIVEVCRDALEELLDQAGFRTVGDDGRLGDDAVKGMGRSVCESGDRAADQDG